MCVIMALCVCDSVDAQLCPTHSSSFASFIVVLVLVVVVCNLLGYTIIIVLFVSQFILAI